jgi:hypothetical protein
VIIAKYQSMCENISLSILANGWETIANYARALGARKGHLRRILIGCFLFIQTVCRRKTAFVVPTTTTTTREKRRSATRWAQQNTNGSYLEGFLQKYGFESQLLTATSFPSLQNVNNRTGGARSDYQFHFQGRYCEKPCLVPDRETKIVTITYAFCIDPLGFNRTIPR